jgi:hypothetical protein
MNSTTSNDAMPEAAPQPEMPIVELSAEALAKAEYRPPQQETTDTSDRLRLMHPGAELGWSDSGGMVEQQASANKWVEAASEARAAMQESPAAEMTDSRQAAQYSRWTGEPLGETAGVSQSAGIGQSH